MNRKLIILLVIGVAVGATVALASLVQSRIGQGIDLNGLNALNSTQTVSSGTELPKLGTMPQIEGIAAWINSPPLTTADLKGKVVLVDFWTYSCINCLRTLPYVTKWYDTYGGKDFVVIGVHTPEFSFEKNLANVQKAVTENGIHYPVALDNDYKTWTNFNNQYWPAHYLFDKDGVLRYVHFGEGNYDETEAAIQQLLGVNQPMVSPTNTTAFQDIKSPETYFGYARGERFASPEPISKDAAAHYSFPATLPLNDWALSGTWTDTSEYAQSGSTDAEMEFHFDAGTANVVMSSVDGTPKTIQASIDGKPLTVGPVSDSKLYSFPAPTAGEHTLLMHFVPGVRIYAITFGANATQ